MLLDGKKEGMIEGQEGATYVPLLGLTWDALSEQRLGGEGDVMKVGQQEKSVWCCERR